MLQDFNSFSKNRIAKKSDRWNSTFHSLICADGAMFIFKSDVRDIRKICEIFHKVGMKVRNVKWIEFFILLDRIAFFFNDCRFYICDHINKIVNTKLNLDDENTFFDRFTLSKNIIMSLRFLSSSKHEKKISPTRSLRKVWRKTHEIFHFKLSFMAKFVWNVVQK